MNLMKRIVVDRFTFILGHGFDLSSISEASTCTSMQI
jgi:hypothetical protein